MSSFLHHEACPFCYSSDAYAVYDDGHTFCFSCRRGKKGQSSLSDVERLLTKFEGDNTKSLPLDFTFSIPKEPFVWLKKYELTNAEIINNKIGWSNEKQLLIFPYFGEDGTVIFWQGRYFPQRKVKCYSAGDITNNLIILASVDCVPSGTCVIVEDPVSAIKVSRIEPTLPLFGSHLSLQKVVRLSKFYSKLVLWLDFDKTAEMIKFQQSYGYLFDSIEIVSTEKDPKEYSTEEIKNLLT